MTIETGGRVGRHNRTIQVKRTKHGYTVNGEFYRRVSTFLNGIPKPWLGPWAAKQVAEFAVDQRERWAELPKREAVKLLKGAPWSRRDDAADRGTAVHRAIEACINNDPIPGDLTTEDELDCAIAVESFMEEFVGECLGAEVIVYSGRFGYAGTLDLWCVDRWGERWLLDWKTSSGIYPEHAVQLAAYAHADWALADKAEASCEHGEAWTGRPVGWGPWRTDRLGVVHVTPERATLYPIASDWNRLWKVFRAAADVKAWQLAVGRSNPEQMFGDPILSTDGA